MNPLKFAGYLALIVSTVAAPRPTPPDVKTIIQRSVAATDNDWNAAPEFSCDVTEKKAGKTRTTHTVMVQGSPYDELIAINGEPLSQGAKSAEQRKLEAVTKQRQRESKQQRAERIARYQRDRARNNFMMQQLTVAFDFKLQGTQKMDGFDVYVLQATPRAGYRPPTMAAKALTGMRGTLWIDQKTFHWVKVEAEVVHPVSIEGFLARVEPGTQFELEKIPVGDGIWLPKHFSMKSRARVLAVVPRSQQEDDTYSNYQKAGN
jgi:hypothetical protein